MMNDDHMIIKMIKVMMMPIKIKNYALNNSLVLIILLYFIVLIILYRLVLTRSYLTNTHRITAFHVRSDLT